MSWQSKWILDDGLPMSLHWFRTNNKETWDSKDIYEVFKTSQAVKHGNSTSPKETTSNVSEAKMKYKAEVRGCQASLYN